MISELDLNMVYWDPVLKLEIFIWGLTGVNKMYLFGLKDIIYDGTPPPAYQQNYIDHVSCLACVCVCV